MDTAAYEVIQSANASAGWAAALLVMIVVAGFALFGVFIRMQNTDLRELNKFCRTEMSAIIDDNTTAFRGFTRIMEKNPCVKDSDMDRILSGEDRDDSSGIAQRVHERRRQREIKKDRDP